MRAVSHGRELIGHRTFATTECYYQQGHRVRGTAGLPSGRFGEETLGMQTSQYLRAIESIDRNLGMPSNDVIERIVRQHKLNSHQTAALKDSIRTILAVKGDIQKLGPYSEFSKSLKRIEKYLGLLRFEVSKNMEQIDQCIGSDMRKSLDHLVAGSSVAQSEGAMGRLYLEMIDALYLPIKKRLDVKNKGGRPLIWTRDLVLEMLARDSEAIIGRRATSTAKGAFERLCQSVLEALSITTDGLEEALKRKFAKASTRRAGA
jgi:hypothetical protein